MSFGGVRVQIAGNHGGALVFVALVEQLEQGFFPPIGRVFRA